MPEESGFAARRVGGRRRARQGWNVEVRVRSDGHRPGAVGVRRVEAVRSTRARRMERSCAATGNSTTAPRSGPASSASSPASRSARGAPTRASSSPISPTDRRAHLRDSPLPARPGREPHRGVEAAPRRRSHPVQSCGRQPVPTDAAHRRLLVVAVAAQPGAEALDPARRAVRHAAAASGEAGRARRRADPHYS